MISSIMGWLRSLVGEPVSMSKPGLAMPFILVRTGKYMPAAYLLRSLVDPDSLPVAML